MKTKFIFIAPTLLILCCIPENSVIKQFIGFTVYKTANQLYNKEDNITFHGKILDEQNLYNQEESCFTCPVNGVYYISLNAMKLDYTNMLLDLRHDHHHVFRMDDSHNPCNVLSNSAVLNCLKGGCLTLISYFL